eukprot:7316157-Ditylum_brightwellii.AAC.1
MKTKHTFSNAPLGRWLIGIAMIHVPKCSLEGAEVFITLIFSSFISEFFPPSLLENIIAITPSKQTIACIMLEEATNTVMLENAATGIDYALIPYDDEDDEERGRIEMFYQGTDVGGGGTRKDLFEKLCTTESVHEDHEEYMYPTCALHGFNLNLSSPCILIMGDGGLLKHDALMPPLSI